MSATSSGPRRSGRRTGVRPRRLRRRFSGIFAVFGRVPLFFCVVHIPFIHVLAMAYSKLRYGFIGPEDGALEGWVGWYLQGARFAPEGYEQNLWLVWAVWIAVSTALFVPCKWYAELEKTTDRPIFSYL